MQLKFNPSRINPDQYHAVKGIHKVTITKRGDYWDWQIHKVAPKGRNFKYVIGRIASLTKIKVRLGAEAEASAKLQELLSLEGRVSDLLSVDG